MGANSTIDQVRSWLPSELVTTLAPEAATPVSEDGRWTCSIATYGVCTSCWTLDVAPLAEVTVTDSLLPVVLLTA